VTTAVATCGTAFGSEHIGVIRRLLMDNDAFSGEVIFTFDGDAAGMKAAERAFNDEQKFIAQTFVAIESSGKDPCELRQSGGDPAVRALVEARIPLVEFVLRSTVNRQNLDSAEGRVAALDKGIPLVAMIKDHALRDEYARRLAGLVGVDDPMRVVTRVRGLVRSSGQRPANTPVPQAETARPAAVAPRVAQHEREVIFTFDGDAAGMKAAERAFNDEQKFIAQTFVAIESSGKDPCELRQSGGDPAVRALVESRIPLVEFVLRSTVNRQNLDSAEGRVAALDKGIPLVAMIKDHALRDEYARRLAGLVGVDDPMRVVTRVRGLVRSSGQRPANTPAPQAETARPAAVSPRVAQHEREVIKAALQLPDTVGKQFDELGAGAFLVAVHQQLQAAIAAAGGAAAASTGPSWVQLVAEHLPPDSEARGAVNALAVESLKSGTDAQPRYADAMVNNLAEQVVAREVAQLKSKVQRLDAVADAEEQGRLFGQLMQLEQRRRELRSRAIGGDS
jgi:DNA primase